MKKLYILTVLALFYQTGNTQTTVISSCYAPESIVELYQLDTDYLTVTKFMIQVIILLLQTIATAFMCPLFLPIV